MEKGVDPISPGPCNRVVRPVVVEGLTVFYARRNRQPSVRLGTTSVVPLQGSAIRQLMDLSRRRC